MDIIQRKELYCQKHPDFQVEYLQVDNLMQNKKDQNLFYCTDCADQDLNFKHSNYQLIKHIIKSGRDTILSKWPPVSDAKLLNELIKIQKGKEEKEQMIRQIQQYFSELKDDILKQIDSCQKRMIEQAEEELPQSQTQVIDRYQALSKISELRSILVDDNTDINEKERRYRLLLDNSLSEKKNITQQLASLLDQHSNQLTIFNTQSPLQLKQDILNNISSIQFFQFADHQNQISIQKSKESKLDVQLLATNLNNGKQYLETSKNQNNQQQIVVITQSEWCLNIVSNIILKRDIKYVFRIEIQMQNQNEQCFIGLIRDENIHVNEGFWDKMSCNLIYLDKCIGKNSSSNLGINKLIKGNEFKLSKENQIEMRVCLQDSILELLDYPYYKCKLVLEDRFLSNLINYTDLRLFLSMRNVQNRLILKEAFTVNKFQ